MGKARRTREAGAMSDNTSRRRPPLLRDRQQRMIAGVCTGLGRHLDMDPVIFRILFVVLTFFGGLGILAYVAAWLLIPAAGTPTSEAQRLLTSSNVYVAAGAAVLMLLGLIVFTRIVARSLDRSIPLVLIAAAAIIGVLIWQNDRKAQSALRPPGDGTGPGRQPGPADPSAQPPSWWQWPVSTDPAQYSANPYPTAPVAPPVKETAEKPAAESVPEPPAASVPEDEPGPADEPEGVPGDTGWGSAPTSVVGGGDVQGVVGGLDAGGGDDPDGPGTGFDLVRDRDGD
jgi:phage shock protein PspC (stress-responsive transcriptional regulator)